MRKTTSGKTKMTLAAAAVALAAAGILLLPGAEAAGDQRVIVPAPAQCDPYNFSTCPQRCVQVCVPSSCSDGACTADCDGPGSCQSPVTLRGSGGDD